MNLFGRYFDQSFKVQLKDSIMRKSFISYQDEYFYGLVSKKEGQKKARCCLKCKVPFESHHFGHRLCAICDISNKRVGVQGRQLVPKK